MATLQAIYNLLTGEGQALFSRHMAAVMMAARAVFIEDAGTANHANRLAWAQKTVFSLESLKTMSQKMYVGVITDPTIQDAGNGATDAQIQSTVNSLVNFYANQLAQGG